MAQLAEALAAEEGVSEDAAQAEAEVAADAVASAVENGASPEAVADAANLLAAARDGDEEKVASELTTNAYNSVMALLNNKTEQGK